MPHASRFGGPRCSSRWPWRPRLGWPAARVSSGSSIDVEPRPLDRILANWREAQLRFELATPGSPEAEAATADIERLREEYQATHEVRMTSDARTLVKATDGYSPA